ncbi:vitamin K epoxide reductase family protein [Naumannella huperziae]
MTMTDELLDDEVVDTDPEPLSRRALGLILVICSAVGLFCAMALSIEKITLLQNPDQALVCDINAQIQCAEVMRSWQSNAFGFPNPFLGLVCFGITIAVGMGLLAGARFAEWFWGGLQAGVIFGAVFVHWLMINTMFDIGAICPYCMAVWAITMPMFFAVTARNLHAWRDAIPGSLRGAAGFLSRMALPLTVVWWIAAAALVVSVILFVL